MKKGEKKGGLLVGYCRNKIFEIFLYDRHKHRKAFLTWMIYAIGAEITELAASFR